MRRFVVAIVAAAALAGWGTSAQADNPGTDSAAAVPAVVQQDLASGDAVSDPASVPVQSEVASDPTPALQQNDTPAADPAPITSRATPRRNTRRRRRLPQTTIRL